uniref:Uncharacterized protein n=1 Tax=Rhizophora mucronata TaxID=61149 RepID=A0A2P2PIF8_RHIMU
MFTIHSMTESAFISFKSSFFNISSLDRRFILANRETSSDLESEKSCRDRT